MVTQETSVDVGKVVLIWTDGGSRPNPGPGGWGVVLKWQKNVKHVCGGELDTTNNRMELMAACRALEMLSRPCEVKLHTDSSYVRNGITTWHKDWVKRGWRTKAGKAVLNRDLWERLLEAAKRHKIEWIWVKGHAGCPENEEADQLATQGREEIEAQG